MLVSAMLDALIIALAFIAVFSVRAFTTDLNYAHGLLYIGFIIAVQLVFLALFGVYKRIWSQTSGHDVTVLIYAVGAAATVTVLTALPQDPRPLPLSVIAIGHALSIGGFAIVRYRSRLVSGMSWRLNVILNGKAPETVAKEKVLIVGAGESGQTLAVRLKHHSPGQNYKVIGFVDEDVTKQGLILESCPILGGWSSIPEIAKKHNVDLIIVAVERLDGPEFRSMLELCGKTDARVKVAPDLFALVNPKNHTPLMRDLRTEDLLGRNPISRHDAVDHTPVSKKIVLVTGAAGSIGSELCRQILSYEPTQLILLDNNESGLHDLTTELWMSAGQSIVVPVLADVTQKDMIDKIMTEYRPQVVFHAAAYKHVPMLEWYPTEAIRVNIQGTDNVARAAQANCVERFVLISTDKAVKPTNAMGASKRACEYIMHALSDEPGNQTLFTAVRFGNVLGSRGSVVPTFARQIENGGPVTVTAFEMTRYFMTIPEAVNLVIHAACLTSGDDVFILKMGETVRIVELAERMIRMRGLRPYKDIPIEFTGIRPGEKLHEELYSAEEQPCETLHPHIIKLEKALDNADRHVFLENLSDLLSQEMDSVKSAAKLKTLTVPQIDRN